MATMKMLPPSPLPGFASEELDTPTAEARHAARLLYRIGPSLPPMADAPVLGDLQLFVPLLQFQETSSLNNFVLPRPPVPPPHVRVRVRWWGDRGMGTCFEPARPPASSLGFNGGSGKLLPTRANTCLYPVRVEEEGGVWRYLQDAEHLTLLVEDARTGRPYAQALVPLSHECLHQRAAMKLRRVPVRLLSLGGWEGRRGGLGEEEERVVGSVWVRVRICLGPHSGLRRVLSVLRRTCQPAPSWLRGLHPEDAQAVMAMAGPTPAPPPSLPPSLPRQDSGEGRGEGPRRAAFCCPLKGARAEARGRERRRATGAVPQPSRPGERGRRREGARRGRRREGARGGRREEDSWREGCGHPLTPS